MKSKYILAVLVAIVLFLLYSRRVSGLPTCPTGQYYNTSAGKCLDGSPTQMSSSTAVTTRTKQVTKR
jgi:hypothetical protein